MATRIDRTAAAAQAAQSKLAKLQAQQARLRSELQQQRKVEAERTKALKDAQCIALGRLVLEAGLQQDELKALIASSGKKHITSES